MAKKSKTPGRSDDVQLADAVRTSAHQIWQAGLGAFAKAQEEGGKVFAKLVKEGTDLQKRTQKLAESKVPGVTDSVSKIADSVSKQASGSWDKLEQVFEDRVSRSLASLGVPTKKDIQVLADRVEELSELVAAYSGKISDVKPTVKKPARRTAAKATTAASPKSRAKPASAKKAVAKKTRTATGKPNGSTP